jgi:hypothetical protein
MVVMLGEAKIHLGGDGSNDHANGNVEGVE